MYKNYIMVIKKDFGLGRKLIPITWFIIMSLKITLIMVLTFS